MLPLLHTMWQADGAFPSGAFAFSYGLEGLVAIDEVSDRASLGAVITTLLKYRWATFDRVALVRAFKAADDVAALSKVDFEVEASTFGEAMRLGSRRNGGSFLTTMSAVGNDKATALKTAVLHKRCIGHIAVMQGAVWPTLGMTLHHVQLASAYIAVNGIVTAAVRLGAVGALQAQSVIGDILPVIEELLTDDIADDAELESYVPLIDVASARQEQAHLRLFGN